MTSLSGVWAASLTPLRADLRPDPERFVAHFEYLLDEGCDGVVLFGTTGEAASFSVEERMRLLDEVVRLGVDPARLIVGVGCAAVTDTINLTRHAAVQAVSAVLALPPFYFKRVSEDGLFDAFSMVVDETPDVRILLYSIPQVAGIEVSPGLASRLTAAYPDRIAGIKDSSGDVGSLRSFLAAMPGDAVFAGTEVLLVPGVSEGMAGTISAVANVNTADMRRVYDAPTQVGADGLDAVRRRFASHPMIPALKAFTAARLDDERWVSVRPPLVALPIEAGAQLLHTMSAVSEMR